MVDLVGDRGLPRLSPPHLYLTLSIAQTNHLLTLPIIAITRNLFCFCRHQIVLKNMNFYFL